MALFMIERQFADRLQLTSDAVRQIKDINSEIGVSWLFSFLSADQKKTYCLYEASNPDAIREQAKVLGIPADVIVEVSKIGPDMFAKSA
jgi:hypothetical protein